MALAERYSNFNYVPALSGESEGSEWQGFRGFVHEAEKAHFNNDFRGNKAYLCGPPLMIDAAKVTFADRGLPVEQLFYDSFEFASH